MVTPLALVRSNPLAGKRVARPVISTAAWGVEFRSCVRLSQRCVMPLCDIISKTRAAAVTQARTQANMLIMAPISMRGPRRGAPAAVARAPGGDAFGVCIGAGRWTPTYLL